MDAKLLWNLFQLTGSPEVFALYRALPESGAGAETA